jgi:hypothetical protein
MLVYNELMQIEDDLQERMVFQNGLNGRSASLGAYMTVIDYENLYKAIEELSYSKEDWLQYAEYNEGFAYLGPTFKLLALIIKRKLNENS